MCKLYAILHFSETLSVSETTESFAGTGDFNSSLIEIWETETNENKAKDALVKNLTSVGEELTNSLATGNQELIQPLLTDFKQVWLHIINKSNEWHGDEPQDLRIYAAKILFLAK
jgi:pyridoxal/pyridoxine/pyridoxamine kinase